jgi:hypothetical protein
MTPKEKARELINKYKNSIILFDDDIDSKKCAIIAINEMTKYIPNVYHDDLIKEKYWKKVKNEIKKL